MDRPTVAEPVTPTPAVGYLCQWVGCSPDSPDMVSLGEHVALTSRLAMHWVHERAQVMAPQLRTPTSWMLAGWARDEAECERALSQLYEGTTYVAEFTEDEGFRPGQYVVIVRPIPAAGSEPAGGAR